MDEHKTTDQIEEPVRLRRRKMAPLPPAGWKRTLLFTLICFLAGVGLLVGGTALIGHLYPDWRGEGTFLGAVGTATRLGGEIFQKPGAVAFAGKDRLNILCLGLDANWTERDIMYTKDARSDTIFVVSLSLPDHTVSILSIPRDSRVLIGKTGSYDKINAAYSYGGVEMARATIEQFLGVPLDHYMVLRVEATKKLVDQLGGIPVDVEKNIDYDDNWGHLHVHLKKGWQRLNGEQAVGYARFRYDEEADFGRIRRQQQVMRALVAEMKRPSHIKDIPGIAAIVKKSVETDLKPEEIVDLIRVFKDIDPAGIQKGMVAGLGEDIEGISYVIPDDKEKERLVKRLLLGMNFLEPRDIRVAILNGSKTPGLAARWRDRFLDLGYQVVLVSNADNTDYAATQILNTLSQPQAAELVAQVLGRGQITPLTPGAPIPTPIPPSPSPGATPRPQGTGEPLASDPPQVIVIIGQDAPDPSKVAIPPAPETPPFPSLLQGQGHEYGGDRWVLPQSPSGGGGESRQGPSRRPQPTSTLEVERGWKEFQPADASPGTGTGASATPETGPGLLPPSTPVKEFPSRLETPASSGPGSASPGGTSSPAAPETPHSAGGQAPASPGTPPASGPSGSGNAPASSSGGAGTP